MSNLYSVGQMNQLADGLEVAGFSPEEVTKLRQFSGLSDFRLVLNGLAEVVQKSVIEKMEQVKTYLRQLFTDLEVGGEDGFETFESSKLFAGGVHGLAVPAAAKGKATSATKATAWEIILAGTVAFLFGDLGERRKCWTEAQVVRFCRDHHDNLSYVTLFEMKGGVVAGVRSCDFSIGQFEAHIFSFSDSTVIPAKSLLRLTPLRHRLISLQ